jgi:protein TonB
MLIIICSQYFNSNGDVMNDPDNLAGPTHSPFDLPKRALPKIAMVIGLHALVLFIVMSGERIVRPKAPQTVMLLALTPPEVVEPPPPEPLPIKSEVPPQVHIAAAPPLRDIDVVPRTEVVPTIVDNAIPVKPAEAKPEGTGTAGTGDAGEGVGGKASARVGAVLDPDNCERPKLPWRAEQRQLAGDVILSVLIDVDGKVTRARVIRSSGHPLLDETALKGARRCRFVAATVNKVPVPSWEPFRFSWVNH